MTSSRGEVPRMSDGRRQTSSVSSTPRARPSAQTRLRDRRRSRIWPTPAGPAMAAAVITSSRACCASHLGPTRRARTTLPAGRRRCHRSVCTRSAGGSTRPYSAICARRSLAKPCHRTLGETDRAGALQRRLGVTPQRSKRCLSVGTRGLADGVAVPGRGRNGVKCTEPTPIGAGP
jgi:hypothetical protein